MGRMYKHNENIPFTMVPDLSIYLLQKYDIKLSWNEYQAIRAGINPVNKEGD